MYDDPQRHWDGRGERHHQSQHVRPVGVNVPVVNLQVLVVTQVEDVGDLESVEMFEWSRELWWTHRTANIYQQLNMQPCLHLQI